MLAENCIWDIHNYTVFFHLYNIIIVLEIFLGFMCIFLLNLIYKHYICILILILVDSWNFMFLSFMLISRPHREPGLLYTLVWLLQFSAACAHTHDTLTCAFPVDLQWYMIFLICLSPLISFQFSPFFIFFVTLLSVFVLFYLHGQYAGSKTFFFFFSIFFKSWDLLSVETPQFVRIKIQT